MFGDLWAFGVWGLGLDNLSILDSGIFIMVQQVALMLLGLVWGWGGLWGLTIGLGF